MAPANRSGSVVTVFQSPMRSRGKIAVAVLAAALAVAPSGAAAAAVAAPPSAGAGAPKLAAQPAQTPLASSLSRAMRSAGSASGAYVVNATTGATVFRWKQGTPRVLASNTKLFTTSAALARFGTEGTLGTEVLGSGALEEDGIWRGNLYLRGGGDPTFGSRTFTRRSYGAGATVEDLAALLEEAGVQRVMGKIIGDESRFDSLRGGPDSGFGTSIWVGPLSGLSYNRGLANEAGSAFQTAPSAFAAARLRAALKARGIPVKGAATGGVTPADANVLASVDSPTMTRLAALTNKPSDNFFAETLAKDLQMQASGRGTTTGGARLAARFASELGARATLTDGSGLHRGNRASPASVVALLRAMMQRDEFDAFYASLSIAGRDGTLSTRMRSGAARGNCRGKTGTLTGVSALSGYCTARSGEIYVFSILINSGSTYTARTVQDRIAQALAAMR
jgi:D-alanyl-D-alanine carboxypeptidase/D-alanyl-D-alanine-endopeptidase (penicillin-binding protein 4)